MTAWDPVFVTKRHYPRCTPAALPPPETCYVCDKPVDHQIHIKPPEVWRICMLRIAGDQMQSKVPVLVFMARDITKATRFDPLPLWGNNVLRSLELLSYALPIPKRSILRGYRQYRVTPLGWHWMGWRPYPQLGEGRQVVQVEQTLVRPPDRQDGPGA